jgi:hypothetical protein
MIINKNKNGVSMSVVIFRKTILGEGYFQVHNSIEDFLKIIKEVYCDKEQEIQCIIEDKATYDREKLYKFNKLVHSQFLLVSEYALLDGLLSRDSEYALDDNKSIISSLRNLGYEVKEELDDSEAYCIVEISKNGSIFYKAN